MGRAIVISEAGGKTAAALADVSLPDPDKIEVAVRVDYSTINYKDALAICGAAPIAKSLPMIPGIDFAGVVESSRSSQFKAGDRVLANGWGYGETKWGGLAESVAADATTLQHVPDALSTKDAMAIGTAGYTAALCVLALQKHGLTPRDGEVLVTGAAGGVGSFAVRLLAALGYDVVASTGRPSENAYLTELGAASVIDRADLASRGKPLQRQRWAGAIDVVGNYTLANICASMNYGGAVAACGLADGMDFPASVAPFILRGVTLYGVDSVYRDMPAREAAWALLSQHINRQTLAQIATEITLEDAIPSARALLDGKVKGRLVVNIAG